MLTDQNTAKLYISIQFAWKCIVFCIPCWEDSGMCLIEFVWPYLAIASLAWYQLNATNYTMSKYWLGWIYDSYAYTSAAIGMPPQNVMPVTTGFIQRNWSVLYIFTSLEKISRYISSRCFSTSCSFCQLNPCSCKNSQIVDTPMLSFMTCSTSAWIL